MKQNMLVFGLTLASLFLVSSNGLISADSKSSQGAAKQAAPSNVTYDIDGKRLRANEKHVAERTLQNGRIIAYRNNKREIAALIKALKQDGITDEKVLNPKSWAGNKCLISNNACLTAANCTLLNKVCKWVAQRTERAASANPAYATLRYCECP